MSNLLPVPVHFFPCPQHLISSGTLRSMKPSEVKLYLFLLYEMQRKSVPTLSFTNRHITKITGVSPRSLRESRIKLSERRLVRTARDEGEAFTYQMLNPESGEPLLRLSSKRKIHFNDPGTAKKPSDTIKEFPRSIKGVPLEFK